MINLLKKIENSLLKNKYNIKVGNYIKIELLIYEGEKIKKQYFKGIIISIKNRGINSSFTIRRIINNNIIERIFLLHSPLINNIIFINHYKVRKSKLYFLKNINNKKINKIKK